MRTPFRTLFVLPLFAVCASPAFAQFPQSELLYDSGPTDGKIAVASRPASAGKNEIEAADDFFLQSADGFVSIRSAVVTGLITGANPVITGVHVEIYDIFPSNSSDPPSGQVPTRTNSPSDTAIVERDSGAGTLTYSIINVNASFTAANSVLDGINPSPNQTTGGEGPVTGQEIMLNITFPSSIDLFADPASGNLYPHYFFVPQVEVDGGEFYWLSAPRPIVPPGTPFPAGVTDLQSWVRNSDLDPDWLRVGTDVVGSGTFNGTVKFGGIIGIPEPGFLALAVAGALSGTGFLLRRKKRKAARP